eukprot:m.88670 g.88670  ORF g.88670 m.88670 type:complete len:125 (-) comp8813_c2_seq4:1746-2120(-)
MGSVLSFVSLTTPKPLEPVCYYLRHEYNSTGEKINNLQSSEHDPSVRMNLPFYKVQQKHWRLLKEDRSKSIFARKKLSDNNISKWMKLYPCWCESDFADLKDQFHTFDVNQDGMIDFEEMFALL